GFMLRVVVPSLPSMRRPAFADQAQQLRPEVVAIAAKFPGTTVQMVEDPPGPAMRSTVLAEIYGKDLEVLRDLSDRAASIFEVM
ncbi:MAG: hypothetical protein P1U91_20695, partial [Pseudophaeobacter sp. bin_em_oilr2.035]